jgi:hypothetical protein
MFAMPSAYRTVSHLLLSLKEIISDPLKRILVTHERKMNNEQIRKPKNPEVDSEEDEY